MLMYLVVALGLVACAVPAGWHLVRSLPSARLSRPMWNAAVLTARGRGYEGRHRLVVESRSWRERALTVVRR